MKVNRLSLKMIYKPQAANCVVASGRVVEIKLFKLL